MVYAMTIALIVIKRVESGNISNPIRLGTASVITPPTRGRIIAIMRSLAWVFSFADDVFK